MQLSVVDHCHLHWLPHPKVVRYRQTVTNDLRRGWHAGHLVTAGPGASTKNRLGGATRSCHMSAVPPQSSAVFGSRLGPPHAHGADVAMECSEMTDYVLIHGAWHGSWCWKRM